MISADDFAALGRRADAAVSARDKAEGAAAQLLERMKSEFGVSGPDAADDLLRDLEREEADLADEYLAAKRAFEEKYAGELR